MPVVWPDWGAAYTVPSDMIVTESPGLIGVPPLLSHWERFGAICTPWAEVAGTHTVTANRPPRVPAIWTVPEIDVNGNVDQSLDARCQTGTACPFGVANARRRRFEELHGSLTIRAEGLAAFD